MTRYAELADVALPDFGLPSVEPAIPAPVYRQRIAALVERARAEEYTIFVVYADREHFANLAYLTGYDPRFEEALLVFNLDAPAARPTLLVGNEGWGYTPISPIQDDLDIVLFQSFSLLGQDRSRSPLLADILGAAGVVRGAQVGVAGWKHFGLSETDRPQTWLEIPAYIVDTLARAGRQPVPRPQRQRPPDGLRSWPARD